MRLKLLIFHLLFALAFLPVAQAVTPVAVPGEIAHDQMAMDGDHVDPGHCVDFDACVCLSHASCDANLEATSTAPEPADRPTGNDFTADSPERFLSHHTERLLRPPRNA
ncbi:MAG TPA: hypothetical protein VKB27_00685 [Gammaproteobacteria bacterium]|nr:hypothetical protein [Gammaproteobacteria bacterium]